MWKCLFFSYEVWEIFKGYVYPRVPPEKSTVITRVGLKVMVTIQYFRHGINHRGTTFMYLQYSYPLIYYLLPNVWKATFNISSSICVDVPYCLPHFQRRKRSLTAAAAWLLAFSLRMVGRVWNIHRTHPISVNAITISSPAWKNHCEGPSTTQEINLSVLKGSQYGTPRNMYTLMVYDDFLTFGKWW